MNIVKEQKKEYVAPEMNVLEYAGATCLLSGSDRTETADDELFDGELG